MIEHESETDCVFRHKYMVENLSQDKLRYLVISESTKTLRVWGYFNIGGWCWVSCTNGQRQCKEEREGVRTMCVFVGGEREQGRRRDEWREGERVRGRIERMRLLWVYKMKWSYWNFIYMLGSRGPTEKGPLGVLPVCLDILCKIFSSHNICYIKHA